MANLGRELDANFRFDPPALAYAGERRHKEAQYVYRVAAAAKLVATFTFAGTPCAHTPS